MVNSSTKPLWEVTILEFNDEGKSWFKVTRRYPDMSIAETRIFLSKAQAKKQFEEWLR
jgi:hypothetical protein